MKKCLLLLIFCSSFLFSQSFDNISYNSAKVTYSGLSKLIKLSDNKFFIYSTNFPSLGFYYQFGFYENGNWRITNTVHYDVGGNFNGDITKINDSTIAVFYGWQFQSNHEIRACLGKISDTTITFSNDSFFETSTALYTNQCFSVEKIDDTTFVGAYCKYYPSSPGSGMLLEFKIRNNVQVLINSSTFYNGALTNICIRAVSPNKFVLAYEASTGQLRIRVVDYLNEISFGNEVITSVVDVDENFQYNFSKLNSTKIAYTGQFTPGYYGLSFLDVSSSSAPVWSSMTPLWNISPLTITGVQSSAVLDSTKIAIQFNSSGGYGVVMAYIDGAITFSNEYVYNNNTVSNANEIIPLTSNTFFINNLYYLYYGKFNLLQLTSPNGGETLFNNKAYNVIWNYNSKIPVVNLDLSTNNGFSWNTVASGIANTGNYNYSPVSISGKNCFLRVTSPTDTNYSDKCDNSFRLVNPIDSNLVLYLPFSGNTVDQSGYLNDPTNQFATPTSDRFGSANSAYYFNGTNAYFQIPYHTSIDLTSNFTVCAWVKPDAFSFLAGVLSKYNSASGNTYFLRCNGTSPYNKVDFCSIISTSTLSQDTWYFLTGKVEGTTGKTYINGSLVGSGTIPSTLVKTPDVITIGVDYLPSPRYFKGSIDDIRIYNRVLTDQEIINLYVSNTVLPVELSKFNYEYSNRSVIIRWSTQSEINSSSFQVQRKIGMTEWVNIGSIPAAGNSSAIKEYSFVDKNELAGKFAYRLKMVDNDGAFKYSPIIEAVIGVPKEYSLSQNYPNPFNPSTKIEYTLPSNGHVKLQVYSVTGQLVKILADENKDAGYYTIDFNGSNLSSGMYIYRLSVNNKNIVKKMLYLK